VLRATGTEFEVPGAVRAHLEAGSGGRLPETLKPADPSLKRAEYRIVATLSDALEAAASGGEARGLRVQRLGEVLYGEARELARTLTHEVEAARAQGMELLVAGGEPTVQVRGSGRGGRAQELALAFLLELQDTAGVTALFAGSDGTDGPTDAAGGIVDAES